jgi:Uma2 family endonuclease
MAQTTAKRMTLEEYLEYDDGTDLHHEFVDGVLIEMPPESPLNSLISLYLLSKFLQILPIEQIRHKDTEILTANRVRLPDLIVLSEELANVLRTARRGTITLDMPSPVLVVEVVSPGKINENRDYRYKRSEYAARGILEYWIVDPTVNRVTVLSLVEGLYEESVFEGNQAIASPTFPNLYLLAIQVLNARD